MEYMIGITGLIPQKCFLGSFKNDFSLFHDREKCRAQSR